MLRYIQIVLQTFFQIIVRNKSIEIFIETLKGFLSIQRLILNPVSQLLYNARFPVEVILGDRVTKMLLFANFQKLVVVNQAIFVFVHDVV